MIKLSLVIGTIVLCVLAVQHTSHDRVYKRAIQRDLDALEEIVRYDQAIKSIEQAVVACKQVG